ncbi:sarcoplasmic reticulum histidine-rich calcium-binding protein-like [Leguminivora glycinivorella]|uniref:sarcoplasmic reticulum histidine-rich calcium-binding protein-like n=1 Tax=Leguminivora glycinivorella TaxID=1035111 RepID=UPI00200C0CB7|nr:sarcoplasmic reticulum histidine-rich calcium-binding protein-like [Leguminivora glycinivorella]
MILKSFVVAIILSFAWMKSVAGGTSYSNVYMQSGPGLGFYSPAALKSAQLAPLAAAPLMSNVLPPCVSPCVVPSQQVAALTPVATSSANLVTYKSPIRVPVVVAPKNDDATSYEYSYVVYDEDTGDQKAQKESSDGSVVRGQYSLIQPDGYAREVQYTADDSRGFNAVVKNFLPKDAVKSAPCPEVKSEPLKEAREKSDEAHDLEPEAHGHSHEGESHEEHAAHAEPKHEEHGHEEPEKYEDHGGHAKHGSHKEPVVHGGHKEPESHEKHGTSWSHQEHGSHGEPASESHEGHDEHAEPDWHGEHAKPGGHDETVHGGHSEHEEHKSPEGYAEPGSHGESHSAGEHGSEQKEGDPRATQGVVVLPSVADTYVSYNDVIKCIQSAINRANTAQPLASPLTYIVLNKPC